LFHHKAPVADGKFEKILAAYSRWRGSHPEIAKSDGPTEATEATGSWVPASNSDAPSETLPEIQSVHNVSKTSTEA
jgi:hypothetical protein